MCRLAFVLALCGYLMSEVATAVGSRADLRSLKSKYEKAVKKIGREFTRQMKSWPRDYVAALRDAEVRIQEMGNLTGVLAVRTERFAL